MNSIYIKIILFLLLIIVFTIAFSFTFSGMIQAYKENIMWLFILENMLFSLILVIFIINIIEIYKL